MIPQEVVPFVGERLIGGAYPRLPCGRAKLWGKTGKNWGQTERSPISIRRTIGERSVCPGFPSRFPSSPVSVPGFPERNRRSSPYTLKQVDFFAACIIPENAWYLIPARALVNGDHLKKGPMLCPVEPVEKNRYLYEGYREAWGLLRVKPEKRKPR